MLFFTTLILAILSGAEIDLFTPSFPELQTVFNLSPFMVELLLSVNLIAHCVSALIVGNLGDRYGRKNIIILGLIIFVIGSTMCVFAINYWFLLLGRILQGLGIAGPAVLDFLIIIDNYPAKEQQYRIGLLNGFATLAIALAPVIGSYISLFFKWQGNFTALLLLGIFGLILAIKYLPPSEINHTVKFSIKEYWPVLSSKTAIYFIVAICFITQSYWVFVGISPILYMEGYGVSLKYFGFYQGSLCFLFSIVSLSGNYLIKRLGQRKCFLISLWILIAFAISLSILMIFNINDPLIISMVLLLEAIGAVFPVNILWPLSLLTIPGAKGRMTAIITITRLVVTALGLQVVGFFYSGTFFHIGMVMVVTLTIGLITGYKLLNLVPVESVSPENQENKDFAINHSNLL